MNSVNKERAYRRRQLIGVGRGEGKKEALKVQRLGVLGSDGTADKIEKSRRGNGLDGKKRGPVVSPLSKRFQEHLFSARTVSYLETWGWR